MKQIVLAAAVVWLAAPGAARAGGIFVPGIGPTAQARAGAFVARADDPTAIAHNPAGFGKLNGTVFYVGSNFVKLDLAFTRFGSYEETGKLEPYEGHPYEKIEDDPSPSPGLGPFQMLPIAAVSTDFGMPQLPVRFAIGFFTPHGTASRNFPETTTLSDGTVAPAPQRYDVAVQKGIAADPTIAMAYTPIRGLHIGGRFSWGFSHIETTKIVWAIDNYDEYVEKDSINYIETNDRFVPSFGVGFLYQPAPMFEIGAAYNGAKHIRSKGNLKSVTGDEVPAGNDLQPDEDYWDCAPGGAVGAIRTCLDINLPQTASIGARYIVRDRVGNERADIELDIKWEDWSSATTTINNTDAIGPSGPLDTTQLRHGFQDVISTRVGGSYTMPIGHNALTIRAGVAHDTKTAPMSWTRLDTDGKPRTTLAAGIGFTAPHWRVDLGGGVVVEPTREVRHDCQSPDGPTRAMPGCDGIEDTPVKDRTAPDPSQPLRGTFNQLESPFNAGRYESGYVLMHLGFSTWF